MTYKEFNKTVNHYLLDNNYSEEDIRALVKYSNTIFIYRLRNQDPIYSKFEERFSEVVVPIIESKYSTEVSVGMGIYIRELDLLIGGSPRNGIDYYQVKIE